MRTLITVVTLAMGLTGCNQTTQLNANLQASAPAACKVADETYQKWVIWVAVADVKPKLAEKVEVAYDQVEILCADPSKITIEAVLFQAALFYASVRNAKKGL